MNTLEFIKQRSNMSLEALRKELYELYIKTGYDKSGRIILYPGHRGANVVGPINNECNGLVIYHGNFDSKNEEKKYDVEIKLLSVPMPYLRNIQQVNIKSMVNAWTNDTKIYECVNGTNITLYYFIDKWVISTTKGVEMNNVSWRDKTYQEMIDECLQYVGGWDKFTSLLDPTCCYTAVFRHDDMHVFKSVSKNPKPSDDFHLINITRLADGEELSKYPDTILELSEKTGVLFSSSLKYEEIPPEKILDELNNDCNYAVEEFKVTGVATHGYVIRGLKSGDVLLESSLKKMINMLYSDQYYTRQIYKTSYNRHNFVLLVNYLSVNRSAFLLIFPHYSEEYKRFDCATQELISNLKTLYQFARQKNKNNTKTHNSRLYDDNLKIANEIKQNIDQVMTINVDHKHFEPKMMQMLYLPENFDAIYRFIYKST